MKHIVKYLKPFAFGVLLSTILLFVQGICDLKLPNYMSDIVNVGIQQGGVEEISPEAISPQGYEFIKNFMTSDEKKVLENSYILENTKDYGEKYKNFDGEKIYIKNTDNSSELDDIFSYASWTLISVLQDMSNGENQGEMSEMGEMNIEEMYPFAQVVQMMPEEKMQEYLEKSREMDILLASQTGVVFTKAYYQELGVDISNMQTMYIIKIGGIMLLVALLGGVATVCVSLITSRIAAGVARNLRTQLFDKINSFTNEEYDKFSTSSLITRSTNDVMQIQMLCMMGLRFIFYSPIMVIGGVIMAVDKSLSMAWIIALSCILIVGFIGVVMSFVMPKFKIMQKLVDKINLVARETLNGLMVIRAFGTADFEKKRFEKANDNYTKNNLFVNKTMSAMMPFMMLIMNGTSILIVWVGAGQIANSTMQVGDMMAYIQYAMQIIMSFLMISMMFVFVPRAIVSAHRINEVLSTETTIKDPEFSSEIVPEKKGFVEFKNVSFRYHGADEDALENISFVAKPAQTVAFIGSTGSGKTTIANLIPRFYEATSGEVLVDGVNVKNILQHDLHKKIGYVPQKSILMSGTIESNIKYGAKDLSEEELVQFAEISQSIDFINEKDYKFKSFVSQGGTNVSGGQKQRLSIARALAIKPQIFVFDDSFSALDYKTDVTLRKALKEKTKDATVIIIAQRVGTILDADVIHVLDEGKIIGSGTHKELLKSCPAYYEIASTQLSKEELDYE